ncbi:MAG: DUF480 domain-containing protein [Planctomycetes bacterium]|nr:DUF480 domain-containing protein [Planctomycetota bacterium]
MEPSAATSSGALPGALPLNATERRLLGVLIEKGLTTPEYYPMTVSALVAGCNQKNNRDPLTHFDEAQVESGLKALEEKGLVLSVLPESGRVVRWRQELVRKLELTVSELAVLGELFLRGAQSEGDLRGRASRMRPIETLEALRELLEKLRRRAPAMVVRLSPEAAARGVRWTHGFAAAEQLAKWQAEEASGAAMGSASGGATVASSSGAASSGSASAGDPTVAALVERLAALEERVQRLEAQRLL